MIEQLKSAGDQLREAWHNYRRVYSSIQYFHTPRKADPAYTFAPELSHQLGQELAFLSSYELEIQHLKLAINRAHNYSSGLAPINSLPSEILTRIFHLVLAKPCRFHKLSFDDKIRSIKYPRYPDLLGHVCSLWRKTAFSSRSLWCHIDLSPEERWFDGLVARANAYARRAGELPIELHIAEERGGHPHAENTRDSYEELCHVISHISSRVETLEMFVTNDFGGLYRDVLSHMLCNQHPGLTKLVIRSGGVHYDYFISPDYFDPAESDEESGSFSLLALPSPNQVESTFTRLTTLHLRGIFPLWSSTAYHGLVDLRLLSTKQWSHIEQAELISILQSSPGLRTLHFGLEIRGSTPSGEQVTPVYLQDLQSVKIFTFNESGEDPCPSSLLRLLAPGMQPLRLSFNDICQLPDDLVTELERFFARSRVARFSIPVVIPPISLLLRHAAHLECVVFDGFDFDPIVEFHPTALQVDEPPPMLHLKSLHLFKSYLLEDNLRALLTCCPSGIVLHSSHVYRDRSEGTKLTEFTKQELSEAFPAVKITDYEPVDPIADWDLLDE